MTTTTYADKRSVGAKFSDTWDRFCYRIPVVVVRRRTFYKHLEDAMDLGADYERRLQQQEMSAVAAMLSAIQESVTTRTA